MNFFPHLLQIIEEKDGHLKNYSFLCRGLMDH